MSNQVSHSKKIFVVLGMHRSGTSASTRALSALGVKMGSELLGPGADNPKGYFEDGPLLEISSRVMEAVGIAWDSPRMVDPEGFEQPILKSLEMEAVQLIRERFGNDPICGFKNPRTARIWPFWKRVFDRSGHDVSFLVVFRNPLSISKSLHHRNQISPRRAHLLSLIHMTESVIHSGGSRRVALDYDALIDSPLETLNRVADGFGLPPLTAESAPFRSFADDFLSADLRNSQFEAEDLVFDPEISAWAKSAYTLLSRWASEDPALTEQKLQRAFVQIHQRLREAAPLLWDLAETEEAKRGLLTDLEREMAMRQEGALALEGLRGTMDSLRTEFEGARQRAERFEFESARRGEENEENRRVAALLAEQLEASRDETLRLHQRLADTQATLDLAREAEMRLGQAEVELAQRSEEVSRLEEAHLEAAEAHEEEMRALKAAQRAEAARQLAAAEEAHVEALSAWERRFGRVDARVSALESERAADRRIAAEQRSDNVALLSEVEALKDQRDFEAERSRTWMRDRAIQLSSPIAEHVHAMQFTRQWRLTRALQRGVSKIRRRGWTDGMAQLELVALTLQAEAQRDTPDVRQLAVHTAELRQTLQTLSAGELFRFSRVAAGLQNRLRWTRRPDGPFEFVRNRVGELQFFFDHLEGREPAGAFQEVSLQGTSDAGPKAATVDVIVPVYRAREATIRCLESVFAADNRTPHEIVVIDDASGDERLSRQLQTWADEGLLTLLANEQNLGFPGTVNRGMNLHPARDVILLNSDTLVHGDWIDRLRRAATRDWKIASVTPFSNNAEICSYPQICRSDPMPSPEALAVLDDQVARVNPARTVTLPTAVGFCMYINRAALREVGLFDAERFGRGYGEENDFCLRARERGWRHVLAADVFVAHEGGVSFSDAKAELVEEGLAELDALYPGYRDEIQSFIAQDPVRALRQRIDLDEIDSAGKPALLMVSHSKGGGTHRHVLELAQHLEQEGVVVLLLQPGLPGVLKLTRPSQAEAPSENQTDVQGVLNLEFRLPSDFDALVETLRQADVRHVHFQHFLGIDGSVLEIASALGCEFDATLHDYLAICPRVHLIDDRGRYCGLPDVDACRSCVKRNGSEFGFEVNMERWRKEHHARLVRARKVFVPSEDAKLRLAEFLPDIELVVRPHPEDHSGVKSAAAPNRRGGPRRVAVVGAIGPHKGSEFLQACAADAAERRLPLEFHLIGYSDRDDALRRTGKVQISGHYEESELEGLLRAARCQVALIPSLWPETFCYTLSATFKWQLYPVAFDLGAIRDRISNLGWGEVLPLETTAREANDRLLAIEPPAFPIDFSARSADRSGESSGARLHFEQHYDNYVEDYYLGLDQFSKAAGDKLS